MDATNVALSNGALGDYFYTWLVDTQYADPRNVFLLQNGVLRISGDGLGYLATQQVFQDYHLSLEFRWGERNWPWGNQIGKARDSGIFLHATGPDGNSHDGDGAFMAAIECNVFQGAVGDFLLIRGDDTNGDLISPEVHTHVADEMDRDGWPTFKIGGRAQTVKKWDRINHRFKSSDWKDQTDFRAPGDVTVPGAWNRLECRCMGDQILVFVNGVMVNKVKKIWPRKGKILLQCEGSEIFFRNMVVRLERYYGS